ncbi:FAD-dependent oxidoreductase [Nakamurella sp. A5-74]|uniref:FAD-dependent oxidoreductase n=1 Tax=Nakamurella sp. A5-74 TaxID=3158264 RepID=A0AAU8DRJ0_9ACTN
MLLSDVLAGRTALGSLTLPTRSDLRHRLLTGRAAMSIDRRARLVHDAAGDEHPFDLLVLATGAAARIPSVPGLALEHADGEPALPVGAHALRTLDDVAEIIARSDHVAAAVVVGAGVLGVEVAAGLAVRGLAVTLAAHGGVMDRQFAPAAAAVAARRLRVAEVTVLTEVSTEQVLLADGAMCGIRLRPTGSAAGPPIDLAAGLLVLACGTTPEVGLAVAAGLPVEHGVLVDADLASPTDSSVCAIGDCAQPLEGSSGLIAQGWEQSRRLAVRIVTELDADAAAPSAEIVGAATGSTATTSAAAPSGATPSAWPASPTDVVKVKGDGLDLVAFGVSAPGGGGPTGAPGGGAAGSTRSVTLSDPEGGRHLEVVLAGDRVIGGTCIGGGQVTADLVSAYLRRTPVPTDPAQLLVRSVVAAPEVVNPTRMPDHTTVCTCNAVSKGEIVACWVGGGRSVAEVAATTRATTGCGSCTAVVCGLLDWLQESDPDDAAPGYLPETPSAPAGNPPLVASSGFRPMTHGVPSHQFQGST